MTGQELDEIVRELYVLPPTDFVAARNELVREAKAAGSREIAERLQHLRRPTRSAWLVNLLASDSRAMQRLSNLGRQLRDAQTELAHAELRSLAEQRRLLIADLLDQAQTHADEAGVRLSPTVLSEVEATLQAALVDLAGALTIRNGRLVRPLSHAGFGPRPRAHVLQVTSTIELQAVELEQTPIEDELAARRRRTSGLSVVELFEEHRSPGPAPGRGGTRCCRGVPLAGRVRAGGRRGGRGGSRRPGELARHPADRSPPGSGHRPAVSRRCPVAAARRRERSGRGPPAARRRPGLRIQRRVAQQPYAPVRAIETSIPDVDPAPLVVGL